MRRNTILFGLALLGLAFAASPAVAGPPVPTLTGTTSVYLYGYNDQYASWSASVSGGVPPYTYRWGWNGVNTSGPTGTSTFGGTYQAENIDRTWTDVVHVHVTDSVGQTGYTSLAIHVESVSSPCAQPPGSPTPGIC